MNDNRLESFGFVRSIEPKSRRVTVVVSTNRVARDGAIIESSGWDLATYDKNPVVLWAHNDREMPIARTVKSTMTPTELIQVHEFDTDPASEVVWSKVARGFVNATSVRWIPGETATRRVNGRDVLVFTKGHQLLEVSYVSVPADADALVLRADGSPFRAADYSAPASAPLTSSNLKLWADAVEREMAKWKTERLANDLAAAITRGWKQAEAAIPLAYRYRVIGESQVPTHRLEAMVREARESASALGVPRPQLEYFVPVNDSKLASFSAAIDIAGVAPGRRVLVNVGSGYNLRELAHTVAHEMAHHAEPPGLTPSASEEAAEDFARRRCRLQGGPALCRVCQNRPKPERAAFRWHA